MPTVSVIIPNYNHALYLEQRIDSVLNQTFQDFELIILDDCSTDDSRFIIERYRPNKKVSLIDYNLKNSGSTFKQWKKGLQLASGKYIWIAESDDYASDNFLESTVSKFIENPLLTLCYCKSIRVDEKNEYIDDLSGWYQEFGDRRWQSNYINNGIKEIESFGYKKNIIPNASAVLFRKEFAELDTQIENMKLCGDWFFWLKIIEHGDVAYVAHVKNYFRTHPNTVRHRHENLSSSKLEEKEIRDYLNAKGLIKNPSFFASLKRSLFSFLAESN